MRKAVSALAVLGLCVAGFAAGGAGGETGRHGRDHRATAPVTTIARPWVHEAEFAQNPSLRATPDQVVILHLEPAAQAGGLVRNTIPYHVEAPGIFTFCLPADDPHIWAMELVKEARRPLRVVRLPRARRCVQKTLAPGLYTLHVYHQGDAIDPQGKKAFIAASRRRGAPGAGGIPRSFPTSCDPTLLNNPLMALQASNGLFVGLAQPGNVGPYAPIVVEDPTSLVTLEGIGLAWVMCPAEEGQYTFATLIGPQKAVIFYVSSIGYLALNGGQPAAFNLQDLGNSQFTLSLFSRPIQLITQNNALAPNDSNLCAPGACVDVSFAAVLKYYRPGTTVQPLQPGEAAFAPGCNTSHGTWVFTGNIPDVTPFSLLAPILEGGPPIGITPGPLTFVALYSEANYGGSPFRTFLPVGGNEMTCVEDQFPLMSFQITPARQVIIATNQCQNCNLSGIDLSNLNLTGGMFQGSTFAGANLTGTKFVSAHLEGADFSGAAALAGTNFVSAHLPCTKFARTNLTSATFGIALGTDLLLTTDFSCRLDLTGATLTLQTLPLQVWRYFDLTGATITNLAAGGTLSTLANPLDLSGAILTQLNNTPPLTGLSGVILDGANLGCATGARGPVCTQLVGLNLKQASLQQANLAGALLNGIDLTQANLDGATLAGANLGKSPATDTPSTLDGAFLRNVNLAQADLSGASLSHASFYSTGSPGSCAIWCGANQQPACASAQGAVLDNANISNAYLSGVDMSDATGQGVNFAGAVLVGVSFSGARLSGDPQGASLQFPNAFLQGADFTNVTVTGANFTSAYLDLTNTSGANRAFLLDGSYTGFTGYWHTPQTPICAEATYNSPTTSPTSDSSSKCPDGSPGPCSSANWLSPTTPITQAQPPSFPGSTCGATPADFDWTFKSYALTCPLQP